jgi:hypothetical protein
MGFYAPDTFFMDLIEEIRLVGNLRTLGLSCSNDNEVVHFHHADQENLDVRVLKYLLDRGFVQDSQTESDWHCLKIFRTIQSFCACSRIFDPIHHDWWYSILISGKPNIQEDGSGSSVLGSIK